MWSLLSGTLSPLSWRGIVPADALIASQNRLPALIGVGFTSIGLEVRSSSMTASAGSVATLSVPMYEPQPGNDAAKYGKETSALSCPWRRRQLSASR